MLGVWYFGACVVFGVVWCSWFPTMTKPAGPVKGRRAEEEREDFIASVLALSDQYATAPQ